MTSFAAKDSSGFFLLELSAIFLEVEDGIEEFDTDQEPYFSSEATGCVTSVEFHENGI